MSLKNSCVKHIIKSEIMTTLIENGVNLNAKNNFGATAFDIAALKGDEKMTEFLLKNVMLMTEFSTGRCY